MKTTTKAQAARTAHRHEGRFIANRCECCGKGAPMDYFSEGGFTVLCKRCAVKIADLDAASLAQVQAFADALAAW